MVRRFNLEVYNERMSGMDAYLRSSEMTFKEEIQCEELPSIVYPDESISYAEMKRTVEMKRRGMLHTILRSR